MELSKKTLQELKEKKSSIEELNDRYLINSSNKIEAENILKLLNENVCNFKEIVDKCKNIKNKYNAPCLHRLLWHEELFEGLIQNNKLNHEDLSYLLNAIDNDIELGSLCSNISLIKHILNEFVLNKETVDKFKTIVENDKWHENDNIHTIFDLIEHDNKNNKRILKLNELNKKIYLLNSFELNEDQRLELIELIQNNEIAQNRLIQIINSNLENTYDFESLMSYLKKKEKKNLINI